PHLENEEWSTVPTGQEAVYVSQDRAIRSRCEPRNSIGNSYGLFYYCPPAPRCPRSCLPICAALPHRLILDQRPISIGPKSNCSTSLALIALHQDIGMTVWGMGCSTLTSPRCSSEVYWP